MRSRVLVTLLLLGSLTIGTGCSSTDQPKHSTLLPQQTANGACPLSTGTGRHALDYCNSGPGGVGTEGLTQIGQVTSFAGNDGFDSESFNQIINATGPGYDAYDGGGNYPYDPGAYEAQIADVKPGPPSGPCNGSKNVGDTAGLVNNNGTTSQRTIADINTVFSYGGYHIQNSGKMFMSPTPIGWFYKDSGGSYWFQIDPHFSWSFSLGAGVNLGKWLSVTLNINPPADKSPVYVGPNPQEPPHTITTQCFGGGSAFFGDTIS